MASNVSVTLTLNNGLHMPVLGLGTWTSKPEEVAVAIEAAIDSGYRLIDTAFVYQNEAAIGEVLQKLIRSGKVKREELFIVTKLHNQFHKEEDVEPSLRESLKSLQVDYVDAYLIHSPISMKKNPNTMFPLLPSGKTDFDIVDKRDTWKAMEKVYEKGLAKSIGLSNFGQKQIQHILDHAKVIPQILQVELHAYFPQYEMEAFCKKHGIVMMAYGPIGSPNLPNVSWSEIVDFPILMDDPWVRSVAANYNKTPAQVLLRWIIERGIVAIPKSTNPKRIRDNFDVFDFKLTPDDFNTLSNLSIRKRLFIFDIADNSPDYPY